MPNRLLLADEDPKTSRVLEVNLRAAGFEVTTVTTGAAAWVAIEEQMPQVILAATDLAALDGFELCTRVRAREGGRDVAFLLLGSDDSLVYRIKSIEVGADDYLLKPPYVQEVVTRVRALVQRRDRESFTSSARAAEAFTGQLSDLSVVDLLRVIADSRRSGIVHLRGAREAPATIYFRQGQVIDAEVGRLSGINAISRLFSWTAGSFEVHWKPIRRPNAIGLPTPELVLEGMKRLEERNRLAGGLPDLDAVFEVNYRVLAERLSEIPDEVNAVLRLFDGARTLAHVVEDCQLPDPEAMAIAIRLRDEGIIHKVSRPGTADKAAPLVVPPRPSAPPPGGDDVTVVRRITSHGLGSGPVQQSFAARDAARSSAAETVVGPPPAPPGSFDDVDGLMSPAHHAKTDPGLGKPLDLPELDPSARSSEYALVETDAVPAPLAGDRSAPSRSLGAGQATGPNDAGGAQAQQVSADVQRRITEPVTPLDQQAEPPPSEGANALGADVPTMRTQLGLGPFPELLSGRTIASEPSLTDGVASLDSPLTPDDASGPAVASADVGPDKRADGASDGATHADDSAGPSALEEPAPTRRASAAEPTMRMNFVDEEFSAEEALEELGVPGWKRGARIVVAVAVAGALAAVLVHKLRGGVSAPVPPPATAERGAEPAVPAAAASPGPPAAPQPTPPPAAAATAEKPAATAAPATETAPPEPAGKGAEPSPTPQAEKSAPAPAEKAVVEKAVAANAGDARAAVRRPDKPAAPAPAPAPADTVSSAEKPAPPAVAFAHQLATCRSQFLRSRIRDAATTCAAAVEANPNSADALTMMAHVELNRGRLGHANELAQKSIAIDPNQADAYVIIGGVHQDSGRNAQAKVAYRRYLQLAPHGRYADELRSIVGSL